MFSNANGLFKAVAVVISLFFGMAAHAWEFDGGTGEPNDPYRIGTAEQLIGIGSDPNLLDGHFVLVCDIDLDPNLPGGRAFTQAVIAPNFEDSPAFWGTAFTGSFHGDGYVIKNLIVYDGRGHYRGLFGCLGEKAVVRDLGIETATISRPEGRSCYCGALAAVNEGTIISCYAQASVAGETCVGGLVGANWGKIMRCHAGGEVSGTEWVGGLVGSNAERIRGCHATSKVIVAGGDRVVGGGGLVGANEGYVTNCYATGDVLGDGKSVADLGGLAGDNFSVGIIASCYATGDVSASQGGDALGGLVGCMMGGRIYDSYATGNVRGGPGSYALGGLVGDSGGWIVHSYATGAISAGEKSKRLGGLVGRDMEEGGIEASFWNTETSGLLESDAGTGLTTAQMRDIATFLDAGWDFDDEGANGTADVWLMPQTSGFPALALLSDPCEPAQLAGAGTPEDPYRIGTPEDLGAVWHHDPSACYELTGDIDLSGITWSKAPVLEFDGEFNGAGFVISGLAVYGPGDLGLFGVLSRGGVVQDLGIEDANIACGADGGLLGTLVGRNWGGNITRCYGRGHISAGPGSWHLGGLVGRNRGTISDCYALSELCAGHGSYYVGGLVGCSDGEGKVRRSYAAGSVSPAYEDEPIGGLVGANWEEAETVVCYFLALPDGGGPDNGIGVPLTDEEMRQQSNFAGWDFEETWVICEAKDYPRLRWEDVRCEQ